jgi:multidrug transporter EmrE-like cation transporter
MNKTYLFIVMVAIFLTIIEIVGQYNLKQFNLTNSYLNYAVGIFFYIIAIVIFTNMLSYSKIGIINHLWNIFSSVFAFIMAKIFFGETIPLHGLIGIFFSIIGMVLIGIK